MKTIIWIFLFLFPFSSYAAQIDPTQEQVAARMSVIKIPVTEPDIKMQIARYAGAAGLDPSFMVDVARCESGLNPNAVSKTKDYGLFQINQVHFKEVKSMGLDVFDPIDNIQYAIHLLKTGGQRHWVMSRHCWNRNGLYSG